MPDFENFTRAVLCQGEPKRVPQFDGTVAEDIKRRLLDKPIAGIEEVKLRLRTVGFGGGYCCGSSNWIPEYVPPPEYQIDTPIKAQFPGREPQSREGEVEVYVRAGYDRTRE